MGEFGRKRVTDPWEYSFNIFWQPTTDASSKGRRDHEGVRPMFHRIWSQCSEAQSQV